MLFVFGNTLWARGEEVQAAGIGQAEPVEIKLPSGLSFSAGKIDLVEKAIKGDSYQIWDYKTGSTWGYNDRFRKAGGRFSTCSIP